MKRDNDYYYTYSTLNRKNLEVTPDNPYYDLLRSSGDYKASLISDHIYVPISTYESLKNAYAKDLFSANNNVYDLLSGPYSSDIANKLNDSDKSIYQQYYADKLSNAQSYQQLLQSYKDIPSAQVEGLRNAGLNPLLAYSKLGGDSFAGNYSMNSSSGSSVMKSFGTGSNSNNLAAIVSSISAIVKIIATIAAAA